MCVLHVADQDRRWKMAQKGCFPGILPHRWRLMTEQSKRVVWFGKPPASSVLTHTPECAGSPSTTKMPLWFSSWWLHHHGVMIWPELVLPADHALLFISFIIHLPLRVVQILSSSTGYYSIRAFSHMLIPGESGIPVHIKHYSCTHAKQEHNLPFHRNINNMN